LDFTIKKYSELVLAIQHAGYAFQTMEEFMQDPAQKVVVLRHDVDERPENALKMARAEKKLGLRATYYFRIVKISNEPEIIREIASLGHEIGYHYEDFASCKGDKDKAIEQFKENLAYFRTFYPVKTVCMHGSSMSDFDNRTLWKYYQLSDFGIIGEPYLSIDYSHVLYLTDTGRRWNGQKYNIRDTVSSKTSHNFKSSRDIIRAANNNQLPDQIILQSHTLWTESLVEWTWLEIRENLRNKFKVIFVNNPALKKIGYTLIQKYSNRSLSNHR
jgi:hypothetical protein